MKYRLIIIFLLSIVVQSMVSQNPVYRATRTMDFRFDNCTVLQIQGEKATIHITGKAQDVIELKIILVAKHKNQSTALNDLKYIRFASKKEGAKLLLNNYYESTNHKIESNLSVIYELTVPANLAIQLQNLYGSVAMQSLIGTKTVDISFGRLDLQNISGSTNLMLKYSNITAHDVSGQLGGTLSKSDADIADCSADIRFNMNYGTLNAALLNTCDLVHIVGTRTEVILFTATTDYNIDLKTTYSPVLVFNKSVSPSYQVISKTSAKNIMVTTTFCPIKINLK